MSSKAPAKWLAVQYEPTLTPELSGNQPALAPEDIRVVIQKIPILNDTTPILWTKFITKTARTLFVCERTLRLKLYVPRFVKPKLEHDVKPSSVQNVDHGTSTISNVSEHVRGTTIDLNNIKTKPELFSSYCKFKQPDLDPDK
jgi:hypothetical protein